MLIITFSLNFKENENGSSSSTYVKSEIFTIIPFASLFWIIFFWMVKKRNYSKAQPFIFISTFVTIDYLHPSIINSMIDSLSCVEIDNKYLLKIDYFYECYTSDHLKNVKMLCFLIIYHFLLKGLFLGDFLFINLGVLLSSGSFHLL